MDLSLKQAKRDIRAFIQQHWTDQRVAECYAFNADGHMRFSNCCGCIIGVTLSTHLHKTDNTHPCPDILRSHYQIAATLDGGRRAEIAYAQLMYTHGPGRFPGLAQRRFSAILRAEMRRRDRIRAAHQVIEVAAVA